MTVTANKPISAKLFHCQIGSEPGCHMVPGDVIESLTFYITWYKPATTVVVLTTIIQLTVNFKYMWTTFQFDLS